MTQTPNTYRAGPDADGHFGIHGGRYVAGDRDAVIRARPSYEQMLALDTIPAWLAEGKAP